MTMSSLSWLRLLASAMVAALACGARPCGADIRYETTSALRLRADSLRTSRHLKTLPAEALLVPIGQHSDYTGFYRVATTTGDTGWVAGEYLTEVDSDLAAADAPFCPKSVSRGPVKDLQDQDVGEIVLTPKTTTIGKLRALVRPAKRPRDARANSVEKTIYRVSGRLTKWGKEKDGDYHLVLASTSNVAATIVLEIPSASCLDGAPANLKDLIDQARVDVEAKLGAPPGSVRSLPTPVKVTVEGVGFFDFGHSTGHPPNAFELHPLLRVRF